MTQFHLSTGSAPTTLQFFALAPIVRGYIEAMFFTSSGAADDDDLEDAHFGEIAVSTLADIERRCIAFKEENEGLLEAAYEDCTLSDPYNEEAAGRDLWYTSTGHGVGFWDRGLGTVGEALTVAAGRTLYNLTRGDDGLLYLE